MPVTDMDQERRRRFLQWVAVHYGKQRGAQRAVLNDIAKKNIVKPYTEGRVSQLFGAKYEFGEEAAVNIAVALGLPPTTFLVDPPPTNSGAHLSPQALEVALKLDRMKLADREQVMPFVRLAVIADPPEDEAQRKLWAEELANLLRASLERSPSK